MSSAGEQLISDRADGYTVMKVDGSFCSSTFFNNYRDPRWLQKLIWALCSVYYRPHQ